MFRILLTLICIGSVLSANAQVGRGVWYSKAKEKVEAPDRTQLGQLEYKEETNTQLGILSNTYRQKSLGLPNSTFGTRIGFTCHDWQYTNTAPRTVVKLSDGSLGFVWQFGRRSSVLSRQIAHNFRNAQGVWCQNAGSPIASSDSFKTVLAGDNALGGPGFFSFHANPTQLQQYGRTRGQHLLSFNGGLHLKSFGLTFNGGNDSIKSITRISEYDINTPQCRPANGIPLVRRSPVAYNPSLVSDGNNTVYGVTWSNDTLALGASGLAAIGIPNPLVILKSTDKGVTWTNKIIRNLSYQYGFSGVHTMGGYALDVKGNQLAVVVNAFTPAPNQGITTLLLRSFDGGDNFTSQIIDQVSHNDTNRAFQTGIPEMIALYSNDNHFSILIDNNDVVHITSSLGYLICDSLGQKFTHGYRNGGFTNRASGKIIYWNSNMDIGWIQPNGIDFVDSERDGIIRFPPNATASAPGDYIHSAMSQTNLSMDTRGRLYIIYSSLVEGTENCCNNKVTRDIYVVGSSDGGISWTNPVSLPEMVLQDDGVSRGTGDTEDAFPIANREISADDSLHIFWMADGISGINHNGVFAPGYTSATWWMNAIYHMGVHTNDFWKRTAGILFPQELCANNSAPFNVTLSIPDGIQVPQGAVWSVQIDTSRSGWFNSSINHPLPIVNNIFTIGTFNAVTGPGNYNIPCTLPSTIGKGNYRIRIIASFPSTVPNGLFPLFSTGRYKIRISSLIPNRGNAIVTNPPNKRVACKGEHILLSGGDFHYNNFTTNYIWTCSEPGLVTLVPFGNAALAVFNEVGNKDSVVFTYTPATACGTAASERYVIRLNKSTITRVGNTLVAPAGLTNRVWTYNGVQLHNYFNATSITLLGTNNENGTYCVFSEGSDCKACVNININEVQVTKTICKGDAFIFGNQTLTQSGTYNRVIAVNSAIDSIINLTLNVIDTAFTQISTTICKGETYTFGTGLLGASGTYIHRLRASTGCDSIVELKLKVVDTFDLPTSGFICKGSSFTFGNRILTSPGTYNRVAINPTHCDTNFVFTLHVLDSLTTQNISLCRGNLLNFGSTSISQAGVYRRVTTNFLGCDSTIVWNVSIIDTTASSVQAVTCQNIPYVFGNRLLTTSGIYQRVLTNTSGCDSTIRLQLTVNDTSLQILSALGCTGDVISFGNRLVTSSGSYLNRYWNVLGCDSSQLLVALFKPRPIATVVLSQNGARSSYRGLNIVYSWQTLGGTIVSNTDSLIAMNGTYFLVVADTSLGITCADTSEPFTITGGSKIFSNRLNAYPNPASNWLKVEGIELESSINLVSILGLKTPVNQDEEGRIWLTDFPSGVYQLEIINNNVISRIAITIRR